MQNAWGQIVPIKKLVTAIPQSLAIGKTIFLFLQLKMANVICTGELGIERLDFLKIDVEGGETPVILGASETVARHRPIIFTEFNAWTQMTAGARNPMEVLEEWHAAFRHMVAFGPDGRPLPIRDHDGLLWVLHTVLTERHCVDDLILCDDLGWLERWG